MITVRPAGEQADCGTPGMFTAAGFTELTRPSPRRAVVRLDF